MRMHSNTHDFRNETKMHEYIDDEKGRNNNIYNFPLGEKRFVHSDDPINLIDLFKNRNKLDTIVIDSEYYGITKVSLINSEEEVRRRVIMLNKYTVGYISFMLVGAMAASVFVTLGVTRTIPLLATLFCSILMSLFSVGVFFEYVKWEKKHE